MTRFAFAIMAAVMAAPLPALAQEAGEDGSVADSLRDSLNLFSEGAGLLLEGLRDEVSPLLEEVRPFFEEEMVPFLESLGPLIDDLSAYEEPILLDNGDILIRRRPDRPLPETEEVSEALGGSSQLGADDAGDGDTTDPAPQTGLGPVDSILPQSDDEGDAGAGAESILGPDVSLDATPEPGAEADAEAGSDPETEPEPDGSDGQSAPLEGFGNEIDI